MACGRRESAYLRVLHVRKRLHVVHIKKVKEGKFVLRKRIQKKISCLVKKNENETLIGVFNYFRLFQTLIWFFAKISSPLSILTLQRVIDSRNPSRIIVV